MDSSLKGSNLAPKNRSEEALRTFRSLPSKDRSADLLHPPQQFTLLRSLSLPIAIPADTIVYRRRRSRKVRYPDMPSKQKELKDASRAKRAAQALELRFKDAGTESRSRFRPAGAESSLRLRPAAAQAEYKRSSETREIEPDERASIVRGHDSEAPKEAQRTYLHRAPFYVKYRKQVSLLFLLALEVVSYALAHKGKDNMSLAIAVLVLSAVGFCCSIIHLICTCCGAGRLGAGSQVGWMEFSVSLLQFVVAIPPVAGFKLPFDLSGLLPIIVCLIGLWFSGKRHTDVVGGRFIEP